MKCSVAPYLLGWAAACSPAGTAASTVAVDVGHTRAVHGAVSARGRPEFDFNLELAHRLAGTLMERGLQVLPINFDGRIGSLEERPRQAAGADFFISIHHDSVRADLLQRWRWQGQDLNHSEAKRGFGIFVSAKNPDLGTSLTCASAIGARLRRLGFVPASQDSLKHVHTPADADNGVWYYDNLVVLYRTTLPSVLFEAGVIKHREEELELSNPERQARMADALATGIAACLQVKEIPAPE